MTKNKTASSEYFFLVFVYLPYFSISTNLSERSIPKYIMDGRGRSTCGLSKLTAPRLEIKSSRLAAYRFSQRPKNVGLARRHVSRLGPLCQSPECQIQLNERRCHSATLATGIISINDNRKSLACQKEPAR